MSVAPFGDREAEKGLGSLLIDVVDADADGFAVGRDGCGVAGEVAELLVADLEQDGDVGRHEMPGKLDADLEIIVGAGVVVGPACAIARVGGDGVAFAEIVDVLRPEGKEALPTPGLEGGGVLDAEVVGARGGGVVGHLTPPSWCSPRR